MVTKTKTVKGKRTAYKVTAIYTEVSKTRSSLESTVAKARKLSKYAVFSPIRKTARGYAVSIKFVMLAADAALKNEAVNGAKAQGAKVTVKSVRV